MFLFLIIISLANTSFATKINRNYCQDFVYKLLANEQSNSVIAPFVLIVSKNEGKLYLYLNKKQPKIIKTYNVTTGKAFGRKKNVGDKKTPEGVYFTDKFLDLNYFKQKGQVAKYGGFAVSLSYPSPVDRIYKRNGSGIWIHGTDKNDRISKLRDSKGCIVAENKFVQELSKFVLTGITPVIIYEKAPKNISFQLPHKLKLLMNSWKMTWETKNIDAFGNFYSKDFYRFKTRENKIKFINKKKYLSKRYKKISVKIGRAAFYSSEYYSVVQFEQRYQSDQYSSSGIKTLYFVKEKGKYKIISETFLDYQQIKYQKCNQ